MSNSLVWILIGIALIAANLPWVSDRRLLVLAPGPKGKRIAWRWLEWTLLYFVVGALAMGMEQKVNGERYPQGWEFYSVTFCLFLVFALPGFVWRWELRHLFERR